MHVVKEIEKADFDLDLSRFITDEQPNINKERFGQSCKIPKLNDL